MALATLLFIGASPASAQLQIEADDVATVQAAGPRTGSNGKIFFNIQGSGNGSFASFGVADFLPSATVGSSITGLELQLVESNAFFTTNGPFSIYLTDATGVSIQPPPAGATDFLNFQTGNDGQAAIDPLLTNLRLLGSTSFVEDADGSVDSVDLLPALSASIETELLAAINAGTTIRIVLVADDPGTAATYAGIGNFDGPPPTLVVELDGVSGGSGATASDAVINELHYDNAGADTGEFVEIAGTAGDNLGGWRLFFYNGSSSQRSPYGNVVFDALDVLVPDTLGASMGYLVVPFAGIQNGAPDGLALVDPSGTVTEFISYEGSFVAADGPAAGLTSVDIGVSESSSTPIGQSLQLVGTTWTGPAAETPGAANIGISFMALRIPEIQGAAQRSPEEGNAVETSGVVTQVGNFDGVGTFEDVGFFLQDPVGDGDDATSDAIFVVSDVSVAVGDAVTVQGAVEEAGFSRSLPYTRLVATSVSVDGAGNSLPAAVVIGAGGRIPPDASIDDDPSTYDPAADGADFFESLEAMRVTVQNPLVIAPTNGFGEIFVVADLGAGASGISQRGTLNIAPDDFNPEKIQLDPGRETGGIPLPSVDVGAELAHVTGVVGYDFGNYQVQPEAPVTVLKASTLQAQTTSLSSGPREMVVASYNVLNLDPNDGDGDTDVADGRFADIAQQIIGALGAPNVLALQEVQDNSGSVNDGVVSADLTLTTLVQAIAAAGGPQYQFIDNTFIVNNNSGGQPGANIRTAFLYDSAAVDLVPGSVRTVDDVAAFAGARLPLIATFELAGREVTLVNNHFSSKGGSAPIFGTVQPFEERQELTASGDVDANGSLDERIRQATEVRNFVDDVLASDPEQRLVVLGDLNEFEFISPVETILGSVLENLTLRLEDTERYTFNFQGNSQSLDHALVSPSLSAGTSFEVLHVNSEFAQPASDHDPLLVRLDLTPRCNGERATIFVENGQVVGGPLDGRSFRGVLVGTFGRDVIVGTDGPELVTSLPGGDLVCAEGGADTVVGGFGPDELFGGPGNDRLLGGLGFGDLLDGGEGRDRCLGRRAERVSCER